MPDSTGGASSVSLGLDRAHSRQSEMAIGGGGLVPARSRRKRQNAIRPESLMPDFSYSQIAKMIDHSLLQPTLTDRELEDGCQLAREYDLASVCIKPYAVAQATAQLRGSTVAVGTTIGFPHGGHVTRIKVAEAEQALADGARELDMVVNIGKVLTKDWRYVGEDIKAVVDVVHTGR